ncbi:RloB domain-containing protein [Sphaerochaeta halotolerans]|jgi:hypothetical protein|uniref:RloB domain-containing protein n=1 Tax=Sphaerochaeta halotolerans TaxID=2293840 RepID=A0A372MD50_9SPIR|nr:RloB domain-containing protein [Sphaerochaeta halotolerans]MBG0767667.1 RloB domain-containing protein [Spirochaetaceae bacterium]MDN5334913.1 hypothetical protein [Sphaerochaeta sp.]MXI86997.1 RloB domain-containing protein [Sphaerochaeta halotolerans]RFU93719.1 RloB domain-containing protein [Sphaerochaeta halotolerans]
MRLSKQFFFSVEGETELWYLQWLSRSINASERATFKASFDCKIEKDPLSRAKGMSVLGKTIVSHIFDRESEELVHVQQFSTTLERMKKAQYIGKAITYKLGYSNFAFDLWMILHKADCNRALNYRHQYLEPINRAFNEQFPSMKEYKKEDNFKRLLGKLTLADVWVAVDRAERIMERNRENGFPLQRHCGYEYYTVNPALSVGEIVKNILEGCDVPRDFN